MIFPDVTPISKDAFRGTSTTISCTITGLEAKATVIWKKGDEVHDKIVEGNLGEDKIQISTLTADNPQNDEAYTCVVRSGQYANSPQSETIVNLNTFGKLEHIISLYLTILLLPHSFLNSSMTT